MKKTFVGTEVSVSWKAIGEWYRRWFYKMRMFNSING